VQAGPGPNRIDYSGESSYDSEDELEPPRRGQSQRGPAEFGMPNPNPNRRSEREYAHAPSRGQRQPSFDMPMPGASRQHERDQGRAPVPSQRERPAASRESDRRAQAERGPRPSGPPEWGSGGGQRHGPPSTLRPPPFDGERRGGGGGRGEGPPIRMRGPSRDMEPEIIRPSRGRDVRGSPPYLSERNESADDSSSQETLVDTVHGARRGTRGGVRGEWRPPHLLGMLPDGRDIGPSPLSDDALPRHPSPARRPAAVRDIRPNRRYVSDDALPRHPLPSRHPTVLRRPIRDIRPTTHSTSGDTLPRHPTPARYSATLGVPPSSRHVPEQRHVSPPSRLKRKKGFANLRRIEAGGWLAYLGCGGRSE